MSKTLLMTVIALTVLASAAIPTASACYSTDPTLNYVVCSREKFDDVNNAVDYAEAGVGLVVDYAVQGVQLVLEIVDHAT